MLKVRLQVFCNDAGWGEESNSEESLELSLSLFAEIPLIPDSFNFRSSVKHNIIVFIYMYVFMYTCMYGEIIL